MKTLIVHIYADPDEYGTESAPAVEPKFLCGGEDEECTHNNRSRALLIDTESKTYRETMCTECVEILGPLGALAATEL